MKKHCIACDQIKDERDFASPGAVVCTFCALADAMKSDAMTTPHALGHRGDNPSMAKLAAHNTRMQVDQPHSFGIKPHPHGHALAKQLLRSGLVKDVEVVQTFADNRPLIDRLQEATFHDPIGLQWIKDKYALRTTLRKAHCFTLDNVTSALVADFSLAIAQDLEAARQLAIPPFPVTWIDLNNEQRIKRVHELGVPLTPTAAGEVAGPVVERVGWLIQPAADAGWYATYCCAVDQGITVAPLSYWWHAGPAFQPSPDDEVVTTDEFMQRLTFGITNVNTNPVDAYPAVTPMHIDILKREDYSQQVRDLMTEIAGELRYIWGLLVALGAGQLGAEAQLTPQPKHSDIRTMPNGKPLLPLEHKILHLHLGKKTPPKVLIAKAIFHHRKRWHEVRSHFRLLKSGKRVPVKSHERGDKKLGRVEKTYKVQK